MNIGIVGTKKFNNYRLLTNIINEVIKKGQISNIRIYSFRDFGYNIKTNSTFGVNYLVKKFSDLHQFPLTFLDTPWNDFDDPDSFVKENDGRQYNSKAPFIRNKNLLNKIDILIILHKDEYDLKDLIKKSTQRGITIFEFPLLKLIKK
jgi:hypothetical protein